MERLERNHGEAIVASGITGNNSLLEVLTSEKTWSVVITSLEENASCLIAGGEHFQFVEQKYPRQVASRCGERTAMRRALEHREQHPVGHGVTANGGHIEIMAAYDAVRSWSLIASVPWGDTCLIATGTHWHIHDQPERRDPTPII